MPGADLGPISMPRQVADLQAQLRRLRAGMTSSGGSGWSPDVDPVVIGHNANSSGLAGLSAVIVGASAEAEGADGAAFGYGASAYGDASVAAGLNAYAGGAYVISIGSSNSATGDGGVSVGASARATADNAVALGTGAHADTLESLSVGFDARTGIGGVQYGVAIGARTRAEGDYNTVVGWEASAGGVFSAAFGALAVATLDHQIMLGTTDEFVEIPGNGPTNGLVLTDTADGTRYLIQITSGALVLGTAP